MQYLAHIRQDRDGCTNIQTVDEHCRNTAEYARRALEEIGLGQGACLAGLIHDAGKCKQEFQRYLLENQGARGTVNHTFAGCRMILEHFHSREDSQKITAELLAYAAGAHHGLFDCMDEQGKSGFQHRMEKKEIGYEESRDQFLSNCAGWAQLEQLFEQAHRELEIAYGRISELAEKNADQEGEDTYFYLGLLARMLLSAVIDGDRTDTAAFMNARQETADSSIPDWNKHLNVVEEKIASFPKNSPINCARAQISDQCRAFAMRSEGIYRLNVPTGAGKTLSSLRYALAHAEKWKKKRIIFVTPLLSILEQNAKVIKEAVGDHSLILEHHSNVIQTDSSRDELDERELAVDSWHAPVILTTLVQLLNTFFLGKTTSVRRFQALCNAVVVIDEVQTVPDHMLNLFNLTVNFLSAVCKTTFLLCSATQPCYEKTEHPLILSSPQDVVPFQKALWTPFQRTQMLDGGVMKLEDIPAYIQRIMKETNSLLVICNKKAEAEMLFRKLKLPDCRCYHLSASMCMAHRRDVLKSVEMSLGQRDGKKTICISTQVMEAGVDISFGRVIRLASGMDSMIQAAGRCNRNGESSTPVPVWIVQCSDENLGRLPEIRRAKMVTIALLNQFKRHPERFGGDLASDAAIAWYYQKLFQEERAIVHYQDYAVAGESYTLLSLLNGTFCLEPSENFVINQAFKLAGTQFHVFDEQAEDVVVPYGDGKKLLEELAAYPRSIPPERLRTWNERAKPYTVSVYDYQKEKMTYAFKEIHGVLALEPECYDPDTGMNMKKENAFLEV